MRLTEQQRDSIIHTFTQVFRPLNAELWLFGSRVDHNKRGGDIDLLVTCHELGYAELSDLKDQYDFLLQKQIGPRKIDIVLDFSEAHEDRPIIVEAKKNGILLAITPLKGKTPC